MTREGLKSMLGIKLVDVDTSNAREEQTGTCELCFGSMWGDYFELEIDNYLNFFDWLSKHDADWNMLTDDGYEYLADLVYWYREENEND